MKGGDIIAVTGEKPKVADGESSIFLPKEQEVHIHIDGVDRSRFHITSQIKPITEHLLKCDDLEVTRKHNNNAGEICQLEGYLPITYLRFKTAPKSENYLSRALMK